MGRGAPARLALPLVWAGARRARSGRARRDRDRKPAPAAWQGLSEQSGAGAGARLARSPEALALYRADLSVVAHHDELAPFDGFTSPAPRAAWLERFWLQRDVAEARDPGERLGEHYRRWFYAWHNFRLVSRHRHYDITERYRTDQLDFD